MVSKKWLGTDFSNKINDDNKIRILIYGSGKAGQQLASSLSLSNEFKLISFIDDNKSFWSGTIDGYSVNPPSSISNLIKSKGVKQLWLAIPNLSGKRRQKLINSLRQYPVHVRTLPTISDLVSGKVRLSDLRELNINELLNREAVVPNDILLKKCIYKKIVLVTAQVEALGQSFVDKL